MAKFRIIKDKFKTEPFTLYEFHQSIVKDDDERFYWYLKNNINKQNINDMSQGHKAALFFAVDEKNIAFTKALIHAGAKINIKNSRKQTPLLVVCSKASYMNQAYTNLFPKFAPPQTKYSINQAQFQKFLALRQKHINIDFELVQLLVDNKADVNSLDEQKNSCLHKAMEAEHLGIVLLLIKKGADLLTQNIDGITPFSLALKQKSDEILSTIFLNSKSLDEVEEFIKEIKDNPETYLTHQNILNSIRINFSLEKKLILNNKQIKQIKL